MSWIESWPTINMQQRRTDLNKLASDLRAVSVPTKIKNPTCNLDHSQYINHLSRYMVVRSAGYVEITRDDCISHFASAKSIPAVHSYVKSGLYNGAGVRPKQLSAFIEKFSPQWKCELDDYLSLDDERLNRLLGQMVGARKNIAHGQSSSINQRNALDMFDCAILVGDWLIKRYDPR